ncbi:unnamed protein product [Clavelina lepadiformis]|uniref:Uncharacterized protein n=1 Tax=Clavelina lepadiformis TaxID=159417 RepID=A0ABP0FS10_CLALP
MLGHHQDGVHDGLHCRHGGRGHLRNIRGAADGHEGSRTPRRDREDDVAEWRNIRDIHGHRDGDERMSMTFLCDVTNKKDDVTNTTYRVINIIDDVIKCCVVCFFLNQNCSFMTQ